MPKITNLEKASKPVNSYKIFGGETPGDSTIKLKI
jgi:hypothetical protein